MPKPAEKKAKLATRCAPPIGWRVARPDVVARGLRCRSTLCAEVLAALALCFACRLSGMLRAKQATHSTKRAKPEQKTPRSHRHEYSIACWALLNRALACWACSVASTAKNFPPSVSTRIQNPTPPASPATTPSDAENRVALGAKAK